MSDTKISEAAVEFFNANPSLAVMYMRQHLEMRHDLEPVAYREFHQERGDEPMEVRVWELAPGLSVPEGAEPLYLHPQSAELDFDVEAMLAACVPGGSIVDPQVVADNIRAWFAKPEELAGQQAATCKQPLQVGEVQGDALNVEQLQELVSRIHSTVSLGHQTGPHAYAGEDFGRYLAEAAGDCQQIMRALAALAARQPGAQEPVAWRYQPNDGLKHPAYTERYAQALTYDANPVPLYAAPPAQGFDLGPVRSALESIERRATEHADDNDADRKRNLYHVLHHAKQALVVVNKAVQP